MLFGQVMFLAVAIYLKYNKLFEDSAKEYDKLLQLIVLVAAFTFVWTGFRIFNKKLKFIKEGNMKFGEKLSQYRSMAIMQWALTEAASIFSIVCFMITGNYAFTGITVVLLFIFSGYYPVKARLVIQMGLSSDEADRL
jgi:hypothetical protein